MTKEEEILYVKPYKRGFATMIDMAITSLIRLIFIQIIGILFINKELIKFHQDFSEKFGVPFSNANQEHILFLSNHDIINVMIFFLIAIILVGSLYHCLLNCSNWSATIGKRICNIVMVTDNGKKLTFLQSASHYVLSMVPWIFIIYIMTFSIQNKLNLYDAITHDFANIIFGVVTAIWINIGSIAKKRNMVQDIVVGCSLVNGKTNKNLFKNKI